MAISEDASANHPLERRLEALTQAVSRINTLQPIDELLLYMAEEGAVALDAQRCTVWLLDEEHDELYSRVAMGITDRELRMPKYEGIAGDTLRTGKVSNVSDATADQRFNTELGQSEAFHTRSLLSMPIVNRDGTTIGVFQVLNKTQGIPFDTADERLAQAFASAVAVAVQNAQQYDMIRKHRDKLDTENVRLKLSLEQSCDFTGFVSTSTSMQRTIEIARRVSDTDVSALITGESGTGKTLLAKCIHMHSPRRNRPFVEINCAAIPEALLEAELFGIEKGVATGVDRRLGKLESANGGTLFLDEIADMSLAIQAKILRVTQEKSFERVGSHQRRQADVRILSATNKDLQTEIARNRFREDLLYRLNVVTLHLPPLRDRPEDIPALAAQLLERLSIRYGRKRPYLSDDMMAAFLDYPWPGNVREMENEIARALVLAGDRRSLGVDDLSDKLRRVVPTGGGSLAPTSRTLAEQVAALEQRLIEAARLTTGGNKSKAARLLGLSREGLRKKMARYGMS